MPVMIHKISWEPFLRALKINLAQKLVACLENKAHLLALGHTIIGAEDIETMDVIVPESVKIAIDQCIEK